MGFNTNSPRAEYVAAQGQTVFPFAFKIYKNTDIIVYKTPVGQTPNDATDKLVLTGQYSVTIDEDAGGNITLVSASTNGDKITILRNLPITREIEYQTNGDLLASTLNQDQNYQAYLIGDMDTRLDRFIRLPDSTQNLNLSLPSPSPETYLRWNSDGTNLENDVVPPTWSIIAEQARDEAVSAKDIVVAKEALMSSHYAAIDANYASIGDINITANDIANINIVADYIINGNIGTGVGGGGQLLGNSIVRGIQYMAQTTNENLTVVSGTNAFSIDSLEVLNDGSITVEDNAVYKVL